MSTDVAVENVLKAQIPEQVFIDESFLFFFFTQSAHCLST